MQSKYFPHVEVIELHHDRSKQTHLQVRQLKQQIYLLNHETSAPQTRSTEKEILSGARGANAENIRIHSVRLPGFVAHQEVIFGGQSQTLTIRHDSIHRDSFMPGVCLACKKVMDLNELVYGLEHLL